jgi:hypothetical protein
MIILDQIVEVFVHLHLLPIKMLNAKLNLNREYSAYERTTRATGRMSCLIKNYSKGHVYASA